MWEFPISPPLRIGVRVKFSLSRHCVTSKLRNIFFFVLLIRGFCHASVCACTVRHFIVSQVCGRRKHHCRKRGRGTRRCVCTLQGKSSFGDEGRGGLGCGVSLPVTNGHVFLGGGEGIPVVSCSLRTSCGLLFSSLEMVAVSSEPNLSLSPPPSPIPGGTKAAPQPSFAPKISSPNELCNNGEVVTTVPR